MNGEVPVLLDTDIGTDIDDAVALSYLLAERRCNLLGVSTVTGGAPKRAMLADAICRAAGRKDVPVWSGAEAPLLVEQRQKDVPQAEALYNWDHQEYVQHILAVMQMGDFIGAYPQEVVLISIGPLTNLGLLFRLDPEIPRMLDRLVVMGGTYQPPGCEWNISGDPHAAAVVFGADVPRVQVYGLNVTTRCKKSAAECREACSGGPLDLVAEMAEVWFRKTDEMTFHDPLAACCIFEPDICSYLYGEVEVEYTDPDRMGHTSLEEKQSGKHGVAMDVNPDEFFDRYFNTIDVFS